jgi:hypothetical protein
VVGNSGPEEEAVLVVDWIRPVADPVKPTIPKPMAAEQRLVARKRRKVAVPDFEFEPPFMKPHLLLNRSLT